MAAKAKIDPRIGPMQGVHPNPKANPTINGKIKFKDSKFISEETIFKGKIGRIRDIKIHK